MSNRVSVSKRYQLPALHQLKSDHYSSETNQRIFGACSRLHGHDYQLEVTLSGEADSHNGLLINRDDLDRMVKQHCIDPFSGRNLSAHFSHTTGEALAVEFYKLLQQHLPPNLSLKRLTVNETAKNSFTVGQ
jgi:6-pyruvoyltetrahydropterin/6-carboxytetrahydropterin synthase